MKITKTHGLEENEMELVKLLAADRETTGDIKDFFSNKIHLHSLFFSPALNICILRLTAPI